MKTPEEIKELLKAVNKKIYDEYKPITLHQTMIATFYSTLDALGLLKKDKKHCTKCEHLNDELECER